MNTSFKGFGENAVTFEADTTLTTAGVPVKITADGKVAPCANGDKICGVALSVRDGFACVQLKGYTELPLDGEVTLGFVSIAAKTGGKVSVNAAGREVLVLSAGNGTVGFIL
ncbi:MAG: hypothetical protein Q4D44_02640 [Eubacteriales bacterium]|nr:hypothetical protein [Eubacteriales bacterium]